MTPPGYEILRRLGEGGMGTVYLARHLVLGRLVAVKVLLPELSRQPEMLQRTFNEARLLAGLRHPGLVDVYDFGHGTDGSAYIVMEYLEGETLADLLAREGRLPVPLTVALARQVAGAAAVAHARGVVHRDLKPDNVFLTRDDDVAWGRRARLLDFGIAKLAASDGGVRTQTGRLLGTPAYMAPEQWRATGEIDARCDIYALGAMLFEMVCGRRVFTQEGMGELIAAHLFEAPPRPAQIEPSVPPWLEAAILQALEKDPASRPSSMDELADALADGLAAGGRTSSAPPSRRRSSRRAVPVPTTLSRLAGEIPISSRRRPTRRAAIVAGALAAAAALALALAPGRGTGKDGTPSRAAATPPPAAVVAPPPAVVVAPPPAVVVAPPPAVVVAPPPAPSAPAVAVAPPPLVAKRPRRPRRTERPPTAPAAPAQGKPAPAPSPGSSASDSINPYPEN